MLLNQGDDEECYSKNTTLDNETGLILNSKGNTDGTQRAINDRQRWENNGASRKNATPSRGEEKAKVKAQKQAKKLLATEAKADLKAQKIHQKELKTATEAAIEKRKPIINFTHFNSIASCFYSKKHDLFARCWFWNSNTRTYIRTYSWQRQKT